MGWRVSEACKATADPSLTTPRLKKTPGAPFAQDDTCCFVGGLAVEEPAGVLSQVLNNKDLGHPAFVAELAE
jgi:hypothetical protein